MYKGLLAIAKESGIILDCVESRKIKLPELREQMLTHPAFSDKNTRLEKLAQCFQINIVWCPKFHCELNPIEGVWCALKRYVRKHNEQDFSKLFDLILEAIDDYENKKLNIKLWKRFWKCIELYKNGAKYTEVLVELFGAKSLETSSHKKNKDFNTNI